MSSLRIKVVKLNAIEDMPQYPSDYSVADVVPVRKRKMSPYVLVGMSTDSYIHTVCCVQSELIRAYDSTHIKPSGL